MRRLYVPMLVILCLASLSLSACGRPAPGASLSETETAKAEGTPAGDQLPLSLTLGPEVSLLGARVPEGGGRLTVDLPGDPLDGLTIDVPAGSYDETVGFDVSYRPVTEATGLGEATVLSPLIEIDNRGAVAQGAVALTVPVTVPEDQFPMAYYYDEVTGALEGVPVLGFSDESVTLATQHFSTLIIMAQDYAALEHMDVDTGFVPGQDTWQFQNQGTFQAPRGICWGMSISSLWYYLEEPGQMSGQRLWGEYDNSLGDAHKTLDYWQDDDWGLIVATAMQLDYDGARRDRSHDVVYQLEQELAGSGARLDLRLSQDQITFYSLVSALVTTNEPQLVNVSTADRKLTHSLIAYKLEGTTVYVADPNDYQANPPQRTLELTDGALSAYSASENVLDQLAGIQSGYTEIRYWGQSALTHWQQVGRLWSQGDRLQSEPAYRLRVVERDARGDVTDEYDLDPLNPLRIAQEDLELRMVPEGDLQARVTLMHFDRRDASLTGTPLPLALGENLVGVYVEGLARWTGADQKPASGWRWLGFHWITVIREDPTPTPTATSTVETDPTATPTATATATPTGQAAANVSFVPEDCECDGVVSSAYQANGVVDYPSHLSCAYDTLPNSPVGNAVRMAIGHDAPGMTVGGALDIIRQGYVNMNADRFCAGLVETLEDTGDRYTVVVMPDPKCATGNCCPSARGWWHAMRAVRVEGAEYSIHYAEEEGIGDRAAALRAMDAAEACALRALGRYESGGQ